MAMINDTHISGGGYAVPNLADPLGMRPNPGSVFDAVEQVVDARIKVALSGRTDQRFDGTPDHMMVLELIARGFAVFKPAVNE